MAKGPKKQKGQQVVKPPEVPKGPDRVQQKLVRKRTEVDTDTRVGSVEEKTEITRSKGSTILVRLALLAGILLILFREGSWVIKGWPVPVGLIWGVAVLMALIMLLPLIPKKAGKKFSFPMAAVAGIVFLLALLAIPLLIAPDQVDTLWTEARNWLYAIVGITVIGAVCSTLTKKKAYLVFGVIISVGLLVYGPLPILTAGQAGKSVISEVTTYAKHQCVTITKDGAIWAKEVRISPLPDGEALEILINKRDAGNWLMLQTKTGLVDVGDGLFGPRGNPDKDPYVDSTFDRSKAGLEARVCSSEAAAITWFMHKRAAPGVFTSRIVRKDIPVVIAILEEWFDKAGSDNITLWLRIVHRPEECNDGNDRGSFTAHVWMAEEPPIGSS